MSARFEFSRMLAATSLHMIAYLLQAETFFVLNEQVLVNFS